MGRETQGEVCPHGMPTYACKDCGKIGADTEVKDNLPADLPEDNLPEPLESGLPPLTDEARKLGEAAERADQQINELTAQREEEDAKQWKEEIYVLKRKLGSTTREKDRLELEKKIDSAEEEVDRLLDQAASRRRYKNGMPAK